MASRPRCVRQLKLADLKVVDATCPLVTKVHLEAVKFAREGYSLVLVGHRDHEEVEGTQGEAPDVTQVVSTLEEVDALVVPDPNKVAYLTQTTLSLDEARYMIEGLKKKFPNIAGPKAQDICYATENRQVAVKNVAHMGRTWCWWSAHVTARIPIGWSKFRKTSAPTPTSSTLRTPYSRSG